MKKKLELVAKVFGEVAVVRNKINKAAVGVNVEELAYILATKALEASKEPSKKGGKASAKKNEKNEAEDFE